MTDNFESLREAILRARDGDDAAEADDGRAGFALRSFWQALLELMPGSSAEEEGQGDSLFALPLARAVSGWGGLAGLATGGIMAWPVGGGSLLALPLIGAILGSAMGLFGLVTFAALVDYFGARVGLSLAALALAWLGWIATTPWLNGGG